MDKLNISVHLDRINCVCGSSKMNETTEEEKKVPSPGLEPVNHPQMTDDPTEKASADEADKKRMIPNE